MSDSTQARSHSFRLVIAVFLLVVVTVLLSVGVPVWLILRRLPMRDLLFPVERAPIVHPLMKEASSVFEIARREGSLGRPLDGLHRIDVLAVSPDVLPDDVCWRWYLTRADLLHQASKQASTDIEGRELKSERDLMLCEAAGMTITREDSISRLETDFVMALMEICQHDD
jgi:hypothetical protein